MRTGLTLAAVNGQSFIYGRNRLQRHEGNWTFCFATNQCYYK